MATGKLVLLDPKGKTTFVLTSGYSSFNFIHLNLLKGKYTVMIDNEWSPEDVKDFSVRIYAESKFAITPA